MTTQPSKYSQYGKVSNATMNYDQVKRDASGAVVSTKYDAYAKISDKPQANYHILPSAQKLYESAFGGAASPSAAPLPGGAGAAAASSSSSASASTSSMPPLGGPPPVPGRPPMSGPPPGLGGAPAPPGGGEADKAKKKLCQRCEVAKATAKVTIEDLPVKLCDPCANAVQSNPIAAREALNRARGGGAGGSSAPPGPCELCRKYPQHVRTTQNDGSAITVCAQCMSFQPFFKQLTTYAVSCVANKNLPEAQTSFEELLMLSPEHPSTLYNCACVEALLQQPDRSLRLLERALKAGYTNYKTIKNDSDLKAVRKLAEFKPLLEKYTSKKGLFTKKPSARDVDAAPPSPSPPGGPVRTPSSGSLLSNSGGAPQPNSNPDYVSSALLQGNYNAVNAVTYSQLQPDAAGGGPPGLGAAPAPPGLGAPPAVPSKGGPPPGAPARTPSTTNAAPAAAAAAAAAAAKPVEYKSLADVKKVAPVVYDAKLGDLAGKTEEKAPVTYESSMEAMKRGAPTPVVYDAKLETDGISAEDLAALDAMAAGLSDDDDNDPPRAPDDIEEPVAASPPTAAAVAAGGPPAIAKPRGALPLPTRGAPPSVPARGAASPIAKPRGPLPTPAARGASPQPGIAKPRGPLPTPGRAAAAPTPAAGLAMPALPAAAVAGGIVLEPLSDDESD